MSWGELYQALMTLTRKEVVRVLRIWQQTLLPPVITMGIYFVVFGRFLGGRIQEIDGYPYIQFIVPGLIMMATITNSFSNVASSFFGHKFQRSIEEVLISPVPDWVIVLGYVSGGVVRGVLCGVLVALVALFFTSIPVAHPVLVVVYLLLTAGVFSLGGLFNGVVARKFDDVAIIPTFVLTPLTYFAGVFYSIKLLPPAWQIASLFNPIFYMVDGFRFGFLGTSDASLTIGIVLLAVTNVFFFALNLWIFKKGWGLRS